MIGIWVLYCKCLKKHKFSILGILYTYYRYKKSCFSLFFCSLLKSYKSFDVIYLILLSILSSIKSFSTVCTLFSFVPKVVIGRKLLLDNQLCFASSALCSLAEHLLSSASNSLLAKAFKLPRNRRNIVWTCVKSVWKCCFWHLLLELLHLKYLIVWLQKYQVKY